MSGLLNKKVPNFEHKGTRIFLITKGCSKKKMRHPIFPLFPPPFSEAFRQIRTSYL